LPGFPRLPCKYIPCADPYMGEGQPGALVDPQKALQGPYGTGMSGPLFGFCPVGRDWLKEVGNPLTGHDWVRAPPQAPKHLDDTDNVMTRLAYKKINAFSNVGHGFYFWNFRTDLYEPDWSYMQAMERGWIPKGNLHDDKIRTACAREDQGEFKCILKHNVQEESVKGALEYIFYMEKKNGDNIDNPIDEFEIMNKTGSDFFKAAEPVMSAYFEEYKSSGATCDFGGVAMLVEENRTISDDDSLGWNDEYLYRTVYRGPSTLTIILLVALATLLGSFLGFLLAMRLSKRFNKRVRESRIFRPLAASTNTLIRKSFALPDDDFFNNNGEFARLVEEGNKSYGKKDKY